MDQAEAKDPDELTPHDRYKKYRKAYHEQYLDHGPITAESVKNLRRALDDHADPVRYPQAEHDVQHYASKAVLHLEEWAQSGPQSSKKTALLAEIQKYHQGPHDARALFTLLEKLAGTHVGYARPAPPPLPGV